LRVQGERRLKPNLAGFFDARYAKQKNLIQTIEGFVVKTTTPLYRTNGNATSEFD
jgi:hypothetical protein